MQTLEAIAKRKSTRDFDPNKAVPDKVVDTIVKAGPSEGTAHYMIIEGISS